ncbi:MAG: hypothetical protein MJZ34_08485 [Paludibacteraceae bacterium]|nr:hypothetical protein [Paludibacteraceae bacterium]
MAVVYFPKEQPKAEVLTEAIALYSGLLKKNQKGVIRFSKVVFIYEDGRIEEMVLY